MNTQKIILLVLFVISVSTLLLAIFGDDNRTVYTVGTIISHMFLVLFGYFYAKRRNEKILGSLKRDILG